MSDRSGVIAFQGNPLTLSGDIVGVGDPAPAFSVLDQGLGEVDVLAQSAKVKILVAVPSLDTPVCDVEARRFNQEASALGEDVAIAVISMDLPFAQARWCGANGIEGVTTYSDHRDADFARKYGLLIKELRLLARAVIVIDENGTIDYMEIVPEVTNEPDYDEALAAARNLL